MSARIVQLLVSPVHRFEGRPADGPREVAGTELVDEVEIRAGLGIVGDRYFGHRAHRDASVTIMSAESLPAGADLTHVRRNILLAGFDIDAVARGTIVELDSGAGPVQFRVGRPASPCAWLDVTIKPGARKQLAGRGGMRTTPLTDGFLRVGAVSVSVLSSAT